MQHFDTVYEPITGADTSTKELDKEYAAFIDMAQTLTIVESTAESTAKETVKNVILTIIFTTLYIISSVMDTNHSIQIEEAYTDKIQTIYSTKKQ